MLFSVGRKWTWSCWIPTRARILLPVTQRGKNIFQTWNPRSRLAFIRTGNDTHIQTDYMKSNDSKRSDDNKMIKYFTIKIKATIFLKIHLKNLYFQRHTVKNIIWQDLNVARYTYTWRITGSSRIMLTSF